ncbi:hypothetical protein PG993_004044 [Apiospora rasikravindrae]|uniref:Nephrocystin 3-like N-terminal domain-containing protein n=1 Tax=Apiospora rasikravindrae TaxID=990691 RepID=A0ABR1TBN4_9PEZI
MSNVPQTNSSDDDQQQLRDVMMPSLPSVDAQCKETQLNDEARDEASMLEEYREYMTGGRPPEYGVEGLVTLRYPSDEPSSASLSQYDIVVVHGMKGARRPPWNNPGSGTSAWVDENDTFKRSHLMSFGYDASRLLSGRSTRSRIHDTALELVHGLLNERNKRGEKDRPIMFIAHDIGCIIVKEALIIAGLSPKSFGDIFDFTRILLLHGCPHRAKNTLDMEERLSQFIYRPDTTSSLPSAAGSVPYLARAVEDVNFRFFESKHYFQCYIWTVYSESENDDIDSVFDFHTGTMGVPFEIPIKHGFDPSRDTERLEAVMKQVDCQVGSTDAHIAHVRALLSAASPLLPGLSHRVSWISDDQRYKAWYTQRKPKLLHLLGCSGDEAQAVSEYVFYHLNQRQCSASGQLVFYFTFDRHDVRRNSIQNMLATFIAQIIGHFPDHDLVASEQLEQLRLQRSWRYEDLLVWFDSYRLFGNIDATSCVLNHFDECDDISSKAFLDFFTSKATIHEHPWRLFITYREARPTPERMSVSNCPAEDVIQPPQTIGQDSDSAMTLTTEKTAIIEEHPELRCIKKFFYEEIDSVAGMEPCLRQMVVDYMTQTGLWVDSQKIGHVFGPVESLSMQSAIQTILGRVACKDLALFVLSWVLHSTRPPTISEMREAITYGVHLGLSRDGPESVQRLPPVETTLETIGGIISCRGNELVVANRQIRDVLLTSTIDDTEFGRTCRFLRTGHHERILKTCLVYLSSCTAGQKMEGLYDISQHRGAHIAVAHDRTSLLHYAIEFWLDHLSQAAKDDEALDIKALLSPLIESGNVQFCLAATWVLANHCTRSHQPHTDIYHVIRGAGLVNKDMEFTGEGEGRSISMIEAFLQGRSDIHEALLATSVHSTESLEQALVAAGACGSESSWRFLIDHIKAHYPEFPWHKQVLQVGRAAWLGLNDTLEALIECGCPLEELDPVNPLGLAIRSNRVDPVRTLLDKGKVNIQQPNIHGVMPLQFAAKFANPMIIRILADAGLDMNRKDSTSTTPLYRACLWGNHEVVRVLASLGADLNTNDREDQKEPGWYPLIVALEEGHLDCARFLLEAGADPNVVGPGGTALVYGTITQSLDICKLLVEKGASVNDTKNTTWSPLGRALWGVGLVQRLETVKFLVEKGANVNSSEPNGNSPLMFACHMSDPEKFAIVDLLLEHGADINHEDEDGFRAMHIADAWSDVAVLRRLLSVEGLELNCPKTDIWSPLKMAIRSASTEVVRMLLDKGAEANVHHESQEPPIMVAVRNDKLDVAQLLIERGANIGALDEELDDTRWYPLEYAVCEGKDEFIRFLCDNGADKDCRWSDGRTLVHKATNWPGLPALLEFRPNVNGVDKQGRTALHEIYPGTPLDNIKSLVRAGADINASTESNITPLLEAIRSEHIAAVEFLVSRSPDLNKAHQLWGGPLHIACNFGQLQVVEDFIKKGADVNLHVPENAGTPLLSTFCSGTSRNPTADDNRSRIVDLLVENGANVATARGKYGTVVGQAALLGNTKTLKLSLSKGGQAGIPDAMGRLPLHSAAVRGNLEDAEILLDEGNDPTLVDKAGRTALHWAVQGGSLAIVDLILSKSAPEGINQRDRDGWTPLSWAARGCGCAAFAKDVDESTQVDVLKRLLDKDASIQNIADLPDRPWTPFGIATYHGRPKAVLGLLAPIILDPKDAQESVPQMSMGQIVTTHENYCDFCYYYQTIMGFRYCCWDCRPLIFDLCYKCYNQRSILHNPDHNFEKIGPEFVAEPLTEDSRPSSRQTSSEVIEESLTDSRGESEDGDSVENDAEED